MEFDALFPSFSYTPQGHAKVIHQPLSKALYR